MVKSIVKVNIRVLEIACVHACVQWGGVLAQQSLSTCTGTTERRTGEQERALRKLIVGAGG